MNAVADSPVARELGLGCSVEGSAVLPVAEPSAGDDDRVALAVVGEFDPSAEAEICAAERTELGSSSWLTLFLLLLLLLLLPPALPLLLMLIWDPSPMLPTSVEDWSDTMSAVELVALGEALGEAAAFGPWMMARELVRAFAAVDFNAGSESDASMETKLRKGISRVTVKGGASSPRNSERSGV